jgi:fucose permease
LFTPNASLSIWSTFAWIFFMSGWYTPTYALAFRVASVKTRAQASAFITGSMVLVGLGIGPLLVGALNDHLKMQYGTDAVRYSLLTVVAVLLLLAFGYAVVAAMVSTWKRNVAAQDKASGSTGVPPPEDAQPDGV